MKPISTAAKDMPRSGIRVILDLAVRMPDVIHLEIGQPNFPTPTHIVEAAHQAMLQGFTKYTPNAGLWSLRETIAAKVSKENSINASADHVVVTTGGMGGLFSSAATILDPGDEILVPDPGYPNYGMMAMLCRAVAVPYPLTGTEHGFQPIVDALPKLVTARTKAIVVNSPSNPTGSVIPRETLAAILRFAQQFDLYVISDESYEKIIYDAQHISPASLDDSGRVLSVFSFSKTYSMTGWRVGYVVTTPELAAIIIKLQEATVACASSVSQKAAEAALAGPQDTILMMVQSYRNQRDAVIDIVRSYGLPTYIPQGAFYLLVDISQARTAHDGNQLQRSEQFARELLMTQNVAVAPGRTFGSLGNRYIRISLAASEADLKNGVARLCEFITR